MKNRSIQMIAFLLSKTMMLQIAKGIMPVAFAQENVLGKVCEEIGEEGTEESAEQAPENNTEETEETTEEESEENLEEASEETSKEKLEGQTEEKQQEEEQQKEQLQQEQLQQEQQPGEEQNSLELEEQFAIALYSEKTQLNTPENLDLNGSKLSWNAVEHANSYTLEIQICNEETTTLLTVPDIENMTYDLTEAFLSSETRLDGGKYAFCVKAVTSEEKRIHRVCICPSVFFFRHQNHAKQLRQQWTAQI